MIANLACNSTPARRNDALPLTILEAKMDHWIEHAGH
jgi:hypothetical protein